MKLVSSRSKLMAFRFSIVSVTLLLSLCNAIYMSDWNTSLFSKGLFENIKYYIFFQRSNAKSEKKRSNTNVLCNNKSSYNFCSVQ